MVGQSTGNIMGGNFQVQQCKLSHESTVMSLDASSNRCRYTVELWKYTKYFYHFSDEHQRHLAATSHREVAHSPTSLSLHHPQFICRRMINLRRSTGWRNWTLNCFVFIRGMIYIQKRFISYLQTN